jgi:predicted ribosome-associated RNA-binding protein Tma20
MAQQMINVGTTPNDGSGDPLRTAFEKCNNNFTELYSTSFTPARIANGASYVQIPSGDGNVEITINDNANIVLITQAGTYVNGVLSATGNIDSGNLRTVGVVSATGNITGSSILASGLVSAAGNIRGANVNAGANVYATTHTGVTASLSGNVQAGNLRTAGQVSAAGNVSGQFIIGDGGFLSNVTVTSNVAVSQIANGTSIISIAGSGANATITVGGVANVAVVASTGLWVSGLLSVTGNIRPGNLTTGGVVQATGNVSGGNILTVGSVSSGGNVDAGNLRTSGVLQATSSVVGGSINTSGLITAAGNIDGGNLRTGGSVSAARNIDGGNILTAGIVSATGNITGNYILGNGSLLSGIITSVANITNGTSNMTVVSSGGNIAASIGGTANVEVIASTGVYITGLSSITGNVQAGNLRTAGLISATGTITGANITGSNILTAGIVSATGNITGGNILGGANVNATTHTGTTVSVSGNVTGGNILTAGIVSATGNITAGNLTVGTGTINVGQIRNTNANGVGNIGSVGGYFNTVFALATSAQYADLAEYYVSDADYEPGTVVKFGGEFEITLANEANDSTIAGIISTCPAYAMNTGIEGTHTVAVALQGRVPCKVQGRVQKGQMMISAGNGYARAEAKPEIGTVIGKALENFDGDQGIIEVVVGRL